MRQTFRSLLSPRTPAASVQPAQAPAMRVLQARELTQVAGGLDVAAEVLKIVQGGGLPPKKKP